MLTEKGTPYTLTLQGPTFTRVTVGDGKASKVVKQQASGVYHSLDGQTFKTLEEVADGMSWACK